MDVSAIVGSSGLNLSLSPEFGSAVTNFSGSLTSSDPVSSVAVNNATNTGCLNFNGNIVNYDQYTFQVPSTGTYTFNFPGAPFGIVANLYAGPYDPASPCTNFVSSSATNGGMGTSLTNIVSASLLPGIEYVLLVSSFSPTLPVLPAAYTVTPLQTVYDNVPPPPAGFSYTYIAVEQATGNIAAININSNFTTLGVGMYTVYGLSYETSNNLSPYIGSAISTFQTDVFNQVVCGAFSLNTITLDIIGSGACPPNLAGANALTGTEFGTEDYETDGEIESTQIIEATANVDYDSGTSIKLEAPFQVKLGASFDAFIDGCNGAMINENIREEK